MNEKDKSQRKKTTYIIVGGIVIGVLVAVGLGRWYYSSNKIQDVKTIQKVDPKDDDEMICDENEETFAVISNVISNTPSMAPLASIHEHKTHDEEEEEEDDDSYRLSEIRLHCTEKSLWVIIDENVYDVTKFYRCHPVSAQFILQFGGKDATNQFDSASHSEYAKDLLSKMRIGLLSKYDCKPKIQKQISVLDWHHLQRNMLTEQYSHLISIKSIYIYPVKGCKGISIPSAIIQQNGLLNDRIYCIIDTQTNCVINQLLYPKLCLIQPVLNDYMKSEQDHTEIELFYFDNNNEINKIIIPTKSDKNCLIQIKFKPSSSDILAYDQGDIASKWFTSFIHNNHNMEENKNKQFRFVKILPTNKRYHEDYFSLSFIHRTSQPIKGVLNYSAINIISTASMNELKRRWNKTDNKYNIDLDRFRVNIVLDGLEEAHFEDYAKLLSIGDNNIQLLWNRRRYMCACPNVNQNNGQPTFEPQKTLHRYRSALTLNDTTALPGKESVFFGSFFLVKKGGNICVGNNVIIRKTQFNVLRTNRGKSFYGMKSVDLYSVPQTDNYKFLSLTQYNEYKLIKKIQLNHDCIFISFELVENKNKNDPQSLGLGIGGHYLFKIENKNKNKNDECNLPIIRAYTPINDDENHFDLVVKIYTNGKMTSYLNDMKIGDIINAKQHYSPIRYISNGKWKFGNSNYSMHDYYTLNANNINLICGGTGITPIIKVMRYINLNKTNNNDKAKICLLYANRRRNDVLLFDQLNNIIKNNQNIKAYYIISRKEEEKDDDDNKDFEIAKIGRIDKELIEKLAFKPKDDCISLLCGSDRMCDALTQSLKQIGFDDKHIHVF